MQLFVFRFIKLSFVILIFVLLVNLKLSVVEAATVSNNITSCEEFERGAKFDPLKVFDSRWRIFYFWADTTEMYPIIFSYPAAERIKKIKRLVDAMEPGLSVEWDEVHLIMEPRPHVKVTLIHGRTPGAYRALVIKQQYDQVRPWPEPLMKLADLRLKQVDRIIGIMSCEELTAYALVRLHEVPLTEDECKRVASKLGFHGPGGRSYLSVEKQMRKNDL